jgi:ammonium transporter, Amt family
MHPIGALVVGVVAGALFVQMFTITQNKLRVDDVLGVWPLHGLCGAWGGIACGIFGAKALGGLGGVSFGAQLAGTALGILVAVIGAAITYGLIRLIWPLGLDEEQEFDGADLSIHKISATPQRDHQSWS